MALCEKNLSQWNNSLPGVLELQGLEKYIQEDVPEPQAPQGATQAVIDVFEEKKDEWCTERAYVKVVLLQTLTAQVQEKLDAQNWNPREKDPKVTYDLIRRAIPRLTREATTDFVMEYLKIDRASFTSMQAFLTRLRFIHKKLAALNAPVNDTFHVTAIVGKLKKTYPERYLFWLAGLKSGSMTWTTLNSELEEISASEEATAKFSKVTIPNNNNSTDNKTSGPGNKIRCPKEGCTHMMMSNYHHRACGHHGPKNAEHCWHCDPERAPDFWKGKKKAIEEKKKREGAGTSTTAVVLHNSGGLANPSTPLIFSSLQVPQLTL
ncbi:hypothetical protein B0T24DRAFT_709887 [Lasiosphaeria ovina]|uniref:Uncharacterized protein n=1 Tax=Lasiosphaeria ovina TaxID=92902 RepID=A0AAE0JZI6_9PEZI|nr:hypothetical protein B0T24DRAFT_709887 [Lasiosphaeria ovina]